MTKLLSLYGRTVSLIGIVFVVSFTVLSLAFMSLSAMEERDRVRDLERTILLANNQVRDFVITRDPQFAKDTEILLQKADNVVRDGIRADNYQKLHNEVLLYLHSVDNLIEVYQQRGFYENEGVEGKIRDRLNWIEAKVEAERADQVLILLLSARRAEKNFLLREDETYADGVHSAVDDLMSSLFESGMSRDDSAELYSELSEYQRDFDELVSLVQQAEWIRDEMKYLQNAIGQTLQHVVDVEQERAQMFLWTSLGLMLLAFGFGIIYSMYVAKSILKPLAHLRQFARRVADGEDIDEGSFVEGDDENEDLSDLMSSFRDVAEQVRLRKEAQDDLLVSKAALRQYADELEERTSQLDEAITDLDEAKIEAEHASKQKAEFLASMSHEIRTPLNGIIGMTSLLSTEEMKADQLEVVDVIRTSGESLLGVVNHVLDFSKIEAGAVTLEEEKYNISACVEDAIGMVSRQAAEKGLDISFIVDSQVPEQVIGDGTRVKQILVNLLGNAVKFTHDGEVQVRVNSFKSGLSNLILQFSVEDTGIGIDQRHIPTLFDPFTQAEASTSRKFGGTGLGLTISQRLAKLMSGSLWVDSILGEGSTFHFTIDSGVTAHVPNRSIGKLDGQNRVLFLNENPMMGTALQSSLHLYGINMKSVSSEAAAISALAEESYFGIFINEDGRVYDGVGGAAVAKVLHDAAPDVPIVLLRHINQNLGGDSVQCLLKPIRRAALHDVILNLASKSETPLKVFSLDSDSEKVRSSGKLAEDRDAVKHNRLKVLIAEDNPVNQKVGVRMLEKLGCVVDVVDNGEKAVESVKSGSYAFVFMDVQMPGMDGLEATREIRKLKDQVEQPIIIALTANVTTADRHQCIEAGMDDYASKPIHPQTLTLLLDRYSSNGNGKQTDHTSA